MQSKGAFVVVGLFVVAAGIAMLGPPGGGIFARVIVVTLLAVGAVLLVAVPGDPLPRWCAVVVAILPTIQLSVLLTVVDTSTTQTQAVTTTVGSGAAMCVFLCVRGRVVTGWAGQVAAFCLYWSAAPDLAAAASTFVTSVGVMLMASFFAYLIRPTAASIYALREEQAAQRVAKAAAAATAEERRRQLRRLDELARPVLVRLAGATEPDDAVAREAILVEASLRDSIRARALYVPEIASAARAARARGVTVQLLDDGGLDGIDAGTVAELRTEIATRLAAAETGSVTVRILPPGRDVLATVVAYRVDDTERYELKAPRT
ncbi:hypothetical protein QMK17_09725 [Rhodococcus sp. G-MC3]|uniref:hypothetical protein n=1 Tax=Rhodococcus sp. G-MC3 TaxID=3046209 RepID=UPI0024B892B9|nr:hypothetical protein [Rhodococcus sp. G-MC3]MDJ0393607.1 hypothetical protein [Rhodococcus sp. G-MC3]